MTMEDRKPQEETPEGKEEAGEISIGGGKY
jgi:hypothetical protein